MKCQKCGNELHDYANFCQNCGNAISNNKENAYTYTPRKQQSVSYENRSSYSLYNNGKNVKNNSEKKEFSFFGSSRSKKDNEKIKSENQKLLQENMELQNQIKRLQSLVTPEIKSIQFIEDHINDLKQQQDKEQAKLEELRDNLLNLNTKIISLNKTIKEKRSEIVCLNDEILVQEFGLYEPQYDFASSLDYKEKLSEIRSYQKELIKNNLAVTGQENWLVNGSSTKGRKMVSDTQKLLLRAFNNECDELISKVKYTNFDASLDKIYKSAEAISKLGTIMDISIRKEYLDCKIKELRLSFEFKQKKQEEKENQRIARAELREAEKLQREIEAQRKIIEKDQAHYENAYKIVCDQLKCSPDNEDLLVKKHLYESHLDEILKKMRDLDYREANQKAGYVYVISNIGSFGKDVYKIGMTRRLNPQERVDELGDASVPFKFDVHAMIFSDDAPALENALHKAFEDRKLNMVNQRREFFNVTLDEIKEVVRKNFDKTVEFIDVPDAEQFRVSEKLRKQHTK